MLVIPFTVSASAVFVYEGDNWTAGLLVKVKKLIEMDGCLPQETGSLGCSLE